MCVQVPCVYLLSPPSAVIWNRYNSVRLHEVTCRHLFSLSHPRTKLSICIYTPTPPTAEESYLSASSPLSTLWKKLYVLICSLSPSHAIKLQYLTVYFFFLLLTEQSYLSASLPLSQPQSKAICLHRHLSLNHRIKLSVRISPSLSTME